MTKTLTDTDIHQILERAALGASQGQLATEFGVARQTIAYQLNKAKFNPHVTYSGPPPGQTLHFAGTFWLYYNTNRGRPSRENPHRPPPWVLRTITNPDAALAPDQLPEGKEIRAHSVTLTHGAAETRFVPNPLWRNKHGDHIRFVRGFLVMTGVVEVKT